MPVLPTLHFSEKNDHQQKFRVSFLDFGGRLKICADFFMVKLVNQKRSIM